jgi:hypothetical protein
VSFLFACASGPRLTPAGYADPKLGYSIPYAKGESAFISRDWVVRSHNSNGEPRMDGEWEVKFPLDHNNDGKPETTLTYPRYDLLLRNANDGAGIGIRRIVLGNSNRAALAPWLRSIGREISGAVWFKDGERNWTSRVRSERLLHVAGLPAAEITLDIADVDRLRLDPRSLDRVMRIVAVEAFSEVFQPAGTREDAPVEYPVRLLAFYDAAPEDFLGHEQEFTSLLNSIVLNGHSGMEAEAVVSPAPAAESAQPAPAGTAAKK